MPMPFPMSTVIQSGAIPCRLRKAKAATMEMFPRVQRPNPGYVCRPLHVERHEQRQNELNEHSDDGDSAGVKRHDADLYIVCFEPFP